MPNDINTPATETEIETETQGSEEAKEVKHRGNAGLVICEVAYDPARRGPHQLTVVSTNPEKFSSQVQADAWIKKHGTAGCSYVPIKLGTVRTLAEEQVVKRSFA